MSLNTQTRAKNLIWGALVADAAAMGLHWIYDQPRIRKIAPTNPEFCEPLKANYDGVPGFFAHPDKTAGEQSQYGEQVLVMLQSLAATNAQFDVNHYAQSFRNHFGYGGAYVGYIDHATRETLNNFIRAEDDATACAKSIPFNGDPSITTFLTNKALATTSQYGKNIVSKKFEEAVRVKHDDDAIVDYALRILENIQAMDITRGANDEQFPATAKLPALIAVLQTNKSTDDTAFSTAIESAIKVTNAHRNALTYGHTCAHLMKAAIDGENADAVVSAGIQASTTEVGSAIESALAMRGSSTLEVTQKFGLACDLTYGVPSIAHNISTAASFKEAIQQNIYAGGDSCGRSVILGAVLGGLYGIGGEKGIPEAWIDRLSAKTDVDAMLSDVFG